MPRLLLLACSGRKNPHPSQLLPAIQRYDGPLWQTLRKHRDPDHPVEVLAISARYGVISEREPLPLYDERMTTRRLAELRRKPVQDPWAGLMTRRDDPVPLEGAPLVVASATYLPLALDALGFLRAKGLLASPGARPLQPVGALGSQRWALRQWLRNPAVHPDWYRPL